MPSARLQYISPLSLQRGVVVLDYEIQTECAGGGAPPVRWDTRFAPMCLSQAELSQSALGDLTGTSTK